MGLALLLLLLCMVAALGVTFARYRADYDAPLFFTVRKPGQVYLGTMATADEPTQLVFDHQSVGSWKQENDSLFLDFTVANGTSLQEYTQEEQCFSVQLVGSLGIWDGTDVVDVLLRVYREEPEGTELQYDDYQGIATRILKESPLYQTYGDGWVFSFLNESGEEITWSLTGNTFSSVDMTVILEGKELTDSSLLQPVITGYSIK
jgi:hypothetical protein